MTSSDVIDASNAQGFHGDGTGQRAKRKDDVKVIMSQQKNLSKVWSPRLSVKLTAQFALITNLVDKLLLFCFEKLRDKKGFSERKCQS